MVEVVRVRFIGSESSRGCEEAPVKILDCFKTISCRENGDSINMDKIRFEEIHVNLHDHAEAEHLIFENGKEIFAKNFHSFFVGGDNSILFPLLKAWNKVEKNNLVIAFDAHTGCDNDSRLDNSWLRKLIKNSFNPSSIILIGTRSYGEDEKNFLKTKGILSIDMNLLREDITGICDLVMERARASTSFFVGIDCDVIDPGFAPGVNVIEPGGMSSRDMLYFLARLRLVSSYRGGAMLSINPLKDYNELTCKLGARILAEMLV